MSCDHDRSAILYIIFTLASLPSTAVVAKLGVKTSLVLASIPYILNILQLFTLRSGYIIFMAVMVGMSAPVLWTALGTFISNNSDAKESEIMSIY